MNSCACLVFCIIPRISSSRILPYRSYCKIYVITEHSRGTEYMLHMNSLPALGFNITFPDSLQTWIFSYYRIIPERSFDCIYQFLSILKMPLNWFYDLFYNYCMRDRTLGGFIALMFRFRAKYRETPEITDNFYGLQRSCFPERVSTFGCWTRGVTATPRNMFTCPRPTRHIGDSGNV